MYTAFLIDDDELILEELASIVPWMDNGFEVIGKATSTKEALDAVPKERPDVIFIDLKMPGMDGIELMKLLKENGTEAEFVMVSAYNEFENVRAFFQQSGFDYVLKPVILEDMQLVLERLQSRLSDKKPREKESGGTDNPAFNALVEYVRENYYEKITLDMLSEKFSFSRNYICGLFSKYLNTSLTCYLTDLRMEHAKEMLKDKTRLIKDVAVCSGYSEYFHFFKVFKEYYGMSPKEMQDQL